MNNIKEKFSGEYSKLQNNNDSDKFLNDDDIVLEDGDCHQKAKSRYLKNNESDSQNSNLIEVLDQDDKSKLIKEDHHRKIPKNDSNVEVLNIENARNPFISTEPPNQNSNGDLFERSIAQYNKEVTENIDKKSSDAVVKQNEILNQNQNQNPNLNLNEILKDQNQFLTYDENGDLIVIEKNSDLIDIEPKGDEELYEMEIDEFNENNNLNVNNDSSLYKGNFNVGNNSMNSSGNRVGFFKRSSMTVSDLTDDSKLRKSISVGDEGSNMQNYIQVADWDFEKEENREKLENDFKEFEKKFFTINKRADLYTLYEKIKTCNIYYQDPKGDYISNVGLVSTLEYMIESTFGFDVNKSPEVIKHFRALDKQIFRWRSIIGDGNCYYRGVIYSFLEKAIFDKNFFLIKKIMMDIDKMINPENEILKYLSLEIQNEILLVNKNLVLKILYLFLEITEQNEDGVQTCYEFLIKCFNFCKHFDQAMTFYLRYLIFDFIRVNKGKLYSTHFAINIGNLLPADYETSSGDFLYDRFFNENLMKSGTDAEKIVIYLTPFVLKSNIKIIIYEFDSPDSFLLTKEFPCYLEDKHEIVVLYRKTHYDIAYVDKYFEQYTKHLSSFVNLEENLRILTFDLLEKIRKSSQSDFNINDNHVSQKQFNIQVNPNNNEAGKQEDNLNSNLANMNLADAIPAREEKAISKCLNCNSDYIHKENVFGFCNICLRNELISNIMGTYLVFSTEAVQLYSQGKEAHIPELLRSILTQKYITVRNFNITISNLASIADMDILSLIKDVKANLCALCQRNVNKEFSIKLPCGCNFCDKNCAIKCLKLFFNKDKEFKDDCYCLCGNVYNTNDFKSIFELLVRLQLKDQMKYLQKYVVESFLKNCFFCLEKTEYDFNLAIVKDPLMTNLYKVKEFKHVICNDCLLKNKIKEKSKVECLICNSSHQITKIKKNFGEIDDNCSIL